MSKTDNITQARLKELLSYDPVTGLFVWLASKGTAKKGSVAGHLDVRGYIRISIDGVLRRAHRLACLYMLGWMPAEVDHDDHVTDNNRWKNLNPATHALNGKNQSRSKRNKSDVTGVRWDKAKKKWRAQIYVNKKNLHLGWFADKPDAVTARKAANIQYGFHKNHGEA